MTSDMQAVNRLFEQEVVAKRNIDALANIYTVGAHVLPPGSDMVTGIDNIKTFWRGAIEGMGITAVKLKTVSLEPMGEGAVEIGQATLEFAAGAPPVLGKYIVVWKRESDLWKWDADIWNTNA